MRPIEDLALNKILRSHSKGPTSGIFTDGSSQPNPGPGGWGFVQVKDDKIVNQDFGHDPDTTNNRMELTALIKAYQSLELDSEEEIFSDSELCVKTVNIWAESWKKKGWKKSSGPIKNLELVQELYALATARPGVRLQWIKAHCGWKWNEYADVLSTSWSRGR